MAEPRVIRVVTVSTAALLVLCAAGPAAAQESWTEVARPYVYQRGGEGNASSLTLDYEAGYGSRESRALGQKGVEQGLRLGAQPFNFLNIEAFGGILLDPERGGTTGEAASLEVTGRVLNQKSHHVNLDVGVGFMHDYRDANIPRVRVGLGGSAGRVDTSIAGLLEIPVGAAARDEVDVMLAAGASYRVTDSFRSGLELAAEDLEGLWDPGEAEGGAKFLFGPTQTLSLPLGMHLKLNTAAVYTYPGNLNTRISGDTWGFMGRFILGYTYK